MKRKRRIKAPKTQGAQRRRRNADRKRIRHARNKPRR